MILFNTDLDNTIIYSYKRDIGEDKKCVEWYQGREISYITKKTEQLLKEVKERCLFVPTTTRTIEQYQRIQLGIGVPEYALVCNGGVLLYRGEFQEDWYQESLCLVQDCRQELEWAVELLENDQNRSLEVRFIQELFVFTKSENPEKTIENLKEGLNVSFVDVFNNGTKVYVVPKKLDKAIAVERLREKLNCNYVIAAGDSAFDCSMLKTVDCGIAHPELYKKEKFQENFYENVVTVEGETVFSDGMLELVLKKIYF